MEVELERLNRCKLLIHSLGISPKLNGYRYLICLIELALQDEGLGVFPLYKNGYVRLATKLNKSISNIDKSIQNAINGACNRANNAELYRLFGATIDESKGKPTNKHFISTILELAMRD